MEDAQLGVRERSMEPCRLSETANGVSCYLASLRWRTRVSWCPDDRGGRAIVLNRDRMNRCFGRVGDDGDEPRRRGNCWTEHAASQGTTLGSVGGIGCGLAGMFLSGHTTQAEDVTR